MFDLISQQNKLIICRNQVFFWGENVIFFENNNEHPDRKNVFQILLHLK